ncbi:Two-component response regulator-like PRR37 [Glycine soja]|uniref:Two-component response regulator-like PRR37 n=1 Tax=Glycine soja TaxID=3848 RepID=A0A0B2QMK6_GLYSO|nr:Two-component response regulator-like PRR37 [Glycine soja]
MPSRPLHMRLSYSICKLSLFHTRLSSWTKRPVEVDSPKPVSQWDQIAECPDSTCAQVVHSNAEICGIVPLAAKECPEQKEQLGKGKVP